MLEIEIPRTHEIAYVVSLLEDAEVEVPAGIAEAESLTPWAGALRYDEVVGPIDRRRAVDLAEASVRWAREFADSAR